MSQRISLRPAGPDDVPAVAAIHVAGYEEAYRGVIPDSVIDERPVELRQRVWGERLADLGPSEFVVVAELDGAVAGFVSGRPATPDEDAAGDRVLCWENLYIAPEHLGSAAGFRLGLDLHEATLAGARERGFSEAVAFPIEGNTRAARFFEALGWKPDGGERTVDGVTQRRLRRDLAGRADPEPAMKRTRAAVEREYGEVKWPAVERAIARERAADPSAGLERVVGRIAATQWEAADPAEAVPFVVAGAPTRLPRSGAFGAAQGIVLEYVRDACRDTTDLIVEMGPGWGWHLLSCWARGGPSRARYVAAEYTQAGRRASSALAELAPELEFTALPFDYHEPSFEDLERGRHAVVFSAHSIEQIPYVKPVLFEAIRGMADEVTCLHFEPVGWQTPGYSGAGSSQNYAESHDYTRNLVPALQEEADAGRLQIDLIQPDVFGINPSNATTIVRWHAGGDGPR